MGKTFIFEGEARNIKARSKEFYGGEVETAVWTDGLSLSCDNGEYCAYRLTKGSRYRVTIERVD